MQVINLTIHNREKEWGVPPRTRALSGTAVKITRTYANLHLIRKQINQGSCSNFLPSVLLTRLGDLSQTSASDDKVTAKMSFFHCRAVTPEQTQSEAVCFHSGRRRESQPSSPSGSGCISLVTPGCTLDKAAEADLFRIFGLLIGLKRSVHLCWTLCVV